MSNWGGGGVDKRSAKKAPKPRRLRIESLENRELLSVSTAEFDAIKSHYADLNLTNYGDYNIIDITTAQLSAQSLQAAIDTAAQTAQDDLIVVRATAECNTITLSGNPLTINIDAALFGSVYIVGLPNNNEIIPLSVQQTTGAAIEIFQGNIALAGMTFFGDVLLNSSISLPEILSVGEQARLTTSSVGFFWQGEKLTYTDRYADGTSQTFLFSEVANLGFCTPYMWTDSVVLSSQESFFLGDNLFRTGQDIRLDFGMSNLGNQGIDNFSAQIWIDDRLTTTIDALTLDAWQFGSLVNVSLGSFAAGTHSVEVALVPTDPNTDPARYSTSFTVTDEVQQLSRPQNVRSEWDANFAGYLLQWDAVADASRYCVEIVDAAGNVQREYYIGTVAWLGKQNPLETGCQIRITAHNAAADSMASVLEPSIGAYARGAWPDTADPYEITAVLRTSGPVQTMRKSIALAIEIGPSEGEFGVMKE